MVTKQAFIRYFLSSILFLSSTVLFAASSQHSTWLTVQDHDLRVKPGSALDFEPIFQGKRAAGDWNQPYLCAPLVFTKPNGFVPKKAELEQLVLELKHRGYNLVRLHYLDNVLMMGAKSNFDFNAEQADRIHYLLALLNHYNIKYMIDAATSWNGAYAVSGKNRFAPKYNVRLDIHFNSQYQEHWKKMVDLILLEKNPYTGKSVLLDPSLIAITTYNELGLAYNIRKESRKGKGFPLIVKYRFQEWLRKNNYPKMEPPKLKEVSEASMLLNTFLVETERNTFAWMSQYLRDKGFQGKITAYNNGKGIQAMAARQDLGLLSVHAYHDHPSQFIRKGSAIKNNSSIEAGLPYMQYMSLVRELGKPFIVDEYDHPYWNTWRREAGIAMASFASFQSWQAICRYANPVILKYRSGAPQRQRAMYPFAVGMDPIARAGEVLSALLYRRQDVSSGGNTLGILFKDTDFTSSRALNKPLSAAYTKMSLLVQIGTIYSQVDNYSPEVVIPFVKETWKTSGQSLWSKNLKVLKNNNLLFNNEFPKQELISSTGELFLNPKEKKLKVITNKTEAIVYDQLTSEENLNNLSILKASGKSVLSVSALDGGDLYSSKRMLIIFATDARNSGSQLNVNGKRLLKLGKLPVQIKSQSATFRLENQYASKMNFYALNLRGERVQKLSVQKNLNSIVLNLDLSKLSNGPTTFFELSVR